MIAGVIMGSALLLREIDLEENLRGDLATATAVMERGIATISCAFASVASCACVCPCEEARFKWRLCGSRRGDLRPSISVRFLPFWVMAGMEGGERGRRQSQGEGGGEKRRGREGKGREKRCSVVSAQGIEGSRPEATRARAAAGGAPGGRCLAVRMRAGADLGRMGGWRPGSAGATREEGGARGSSRSGAGGRGATRHLAGHVGAHEGGRAPWAGRREQRRDTRLSGWA